MDFYKLILPIFKFYQFFGTFRYKVIEKSNVYKLKESKFLTIYSLLIYLINIASQIILIYIEFKKYEGDVIFMEVIVISEYVHMILLSILYIFGGTIIILNGELLAKLLMNLSSYHIKFFKRNSAKITKIYKINIFINIISYGFVIVISVIFILDEDVYISDSNRGIKRFSAFVADITLEFFLVQFFVLVNVIRLHYCLLNSEIFENVKVFKKIDEVKDLIQVWKLGDNLAKYFIEKVNNIYSPTVMLFIAAVMLEIIYTIPAYVSSGFLSMALKYGAWHVHNIVQISLWFGVCAFTRIEV